MPLPRLLALVMVAGLLAGCSVPGAQEAQDALRETQDALSKAREDAQRAQERYERIRSLAVVRSELLDLELRPVVQNSTLSFVVTATRDGIPIPVENLTALPTLVIAGEQEGSWGVACDPLTCSVFLPEEGRALAFWQDLPDERWYVPDETVTRLDAPVVATVSVDDATS